MYINYTHDDANPVCELSQEPKYPISRNPFMFVRDSAGFGNGTCTLQFAIEALDLLQEPCMKQVKAFLAETGFPRLHDTYLQKLQSKLQKALA